MKNLFAPAVISEIELEVSPHLVMIDSFSQQKPSGITVPASNPTLMNADGLKSG
jgi:hypothetical protein